MRLAVLPAATSVQVSTEALTQFDLDLLDALKEHAEFEIIGSSETMAAIQSLEISLSSAAQNAGAREALAGSLHAQAILSTDIAGYGKVKRKWLVWLIGSGIIEGAAEGVAVAQVGGPWAALGVAAEEAAQETAEWGGGAFAFNRIFTPVILEARLWSGADGAKVWSDTVFASHAGKALKAYPKEHRRDRTLRLIVTGRKAAKELAKELAKATRRAR